MPEFTLIVVHHLQLYNMKGPVECVKPEPEKGDDFSEFMWMAEQNMDEFDKQVYQ